LLPSSADVVVVGSGVAGSLVAYRLGLAGARVVLLEAGSRFKRADLVDRFVNSPVKGLMTPFPMLRHAPHPELGNDYLKQKGPHVYDVQYVRGVGGTTWHWAGASWRLLPNDFKLRTRYGVGRDWPLDYPFLEPFYAKAEKELGVAGPDHEDLGSPRMGPYPMKAVPLSYMDRYVQERLAPAGYCLVTDPAARNTRTFDGRPVCCGNNNCMPICPIGAQYSGDVHATKAERAGVQLIENAVAHFVEVGRNGNIAAVHYKFPDGSSQVIRARIFVIAANGIETPKLLLASRSENQPRGVANRSDQVGRNLMDHPGVGVSFSLPDPVYPGRGPQMISSIVNFRDGAFRKEFASKKLHLWNGSDVEGIVRGLVEKGVFGEELAKAFGTFPVGGRL
jgi:choline dehydrogenase-like flavoprotein